MEKFQVMEKEILLIKNKELQEWVRKSLNNTPDYFFKGWASSTGKYHPACTCKDGGLVVHVKRAVYIANRLCGGWGLIEENRDIVLAATILHDIAKVGQGSGPYIDYVNHPLNAEKYLIQDSLNQELYTKINNCIRHHMGLWTPDGVKKPLTEYSLLELAVYSADYMATTKDLITPEDTLG